MTLDSKRLEQWMRRGALPAPSGVGWRILHATRDGAVSAAELESAIASDATLSDHVTRLANVGRAAGRPALGSTAEVLDELGARPVRDLCVALALLNGHRRGPCESYDYDAHWSLALRTAVTAQYLAARTGAVAPARAFTLGLLTEVGRAALASVHPDEYARLWPDLRELDEADRAERERAEFDVDAGELGAALLTAWGFECPSTTVPDSALAATLLVARLIAAGPTGSPDTVVESVGPVALDLLELPQDALRETLDAIGVACSEWGGRLDVPVGDIEVWDSISGAGFDLPDPDEVAGDATRVSTGLRVLAVDDDPVSLRVLSRHLSKAGHSVVEARNGRQALQMTLSDPPQLIVTDWMMPELDGIEYCRALRKTEVGKGIYVLILTAREDEEKIVEAFDAGADDYVVKLSGSPDGAIFNARILLARVRAGQRMIELREQVEREKRRLRAAALTDVLTRLPNRRYAMKRLEQEAARQRRSGGSLSVMMLDIDHFKAVNDVHGHDVGDFVLCETARVLREATRKEDVVCRLGGEEFLVICSGSDLARAEQSAERLRASIEQHRIRLGGELSNVTVSIGVAELTSGVKSIDELLKSADRQVYAAKDGGRNRVCSPSDEHRAAS